MCCTPNDNSNLLHLTLRYVYLKLNVFKTNYSKLLTPRLSDLKHFLLCVWSIMVYVSMVLFIDFTRSVDRKFIDFVL